MCESMHLQQPPSMLYPVWQTGDVALSGEHRSMQRAGRSIACVATGRVHECTASMSRKKCEPTETAEFIIEIYERYGEAGFEMLVGDFVAIVADGQSGKLLCVRSPGHRIAYSSQNYTKASLQQQRIPMSCLRCSGVVDL